MNQLPNDAASDQSNCPEGYYRNSKGMVMQMPEAQAVQCPLDLAAIDGMDVKALKSLIQKVYKAGWGYGGLKGSELIKHALMSKDEAYEALKLTALTLATNASEWREFVALATFWAEREKGKPTQAVDLVIKDGDLLDKLSDERLLRLENELARLNGYDILIIPPEPKKLGNQ